MRAKEKFNFEELEKDLGREHVSLRPGPGKKQLAYLEAWHVIAELNRIFGPDGWSRETVYADCVYEGEKEVKIWDKAAKQYSDKTKMVKAVTYIAKTKLHVCFHDLDDDGRLSIDLIDRDGTGTGHGTDDNYIGLAHEQAIKEAETDAFKRAAMTLGWIFGLALYDPDQKHVTKAVQKKTVKKEPEKDKEEQPVKIGPQIVEPDDIALIAQFCKAANFVSKVHGDDDEFFAYRLYLSTTRDGVETHPRPAELTKLTVLTKTRRAKLTKALEKMLKEYPSAAKVLESGMTAEDIDW